MLGLLLPQRCLACGRTGAAVCTACLDALPRLAPPLCERCGAPTAWPVRRCGECAGRRIAFASARAALVYFHATTSYPTYLYYNPTSTPVEVEVALTGAWDLYDEATDRVLLQNLSGPAPVTIPPGSTILGIAPGDRTSTIEGANDN